MKYLLVITVLAGLTFSCKKENLKKFEGVDYPSNAQIFDVNDNGIADFKLRFEQVSSKDLPVSESIISGYLIELESTLILPHIGGKTFNLAIGDTLKRPGEAISLFDYDRVIVSRNWDGERWDEEYTINSEVPKTYIVGYLLNDGSSEDLGWVKFDINPADASVIVLETKQTSADFMVIE
ncbi:MAG: hypothetical protein ACI8ZM_004479 [Crocinitomix sp.]|jgi:hypothetical protein